MKTPQRKFKDSKTMERIAISKMIQLGVLTFLSLPLSFHTLAQEAAGTHGGGVAVYENDQLALRDLTQENTDCKWKSSHTFLTDTPLGKKVDEILTVAFHVHPLMAYAIRAEFDNISWCLTAKLKPVIVNDEDSVTVNYFKNIQTAVRDIANKKVFLDLTNLKRLPLDHQAMNLIHEIAHSFLPMPQKMRNNNLRSMIREIHDLYVDSQKGEINTWSQIEDLNQTIKDTGFLPKFHFVELGQKLRNFIDSPSDVSASALAEESDRSGDVKDFFTKVAQDLGRPDLLSYHAYSDAIFNPNREEVTDRLPPALHFETPIEKALALFSAGNGGAHTQTTPLERERFLLGNCTLTLSGFFIQRMAGLSSFDKNSVSFKYEVEKAGHSSFGIGMKESYTQHSIFCYVPLSESALTKFKKEVPTYYHQVQGLLAKIKEGYCNNLSAPGIQYFH